MPHLALEVLEHPHGHALQPHVGLVGELLADAPGALARRLRAELGPLEQQHVDVTLRQLIGERAAADAAPADDYISGFHSLAPSPRTRR